jgi:hypothetical protein
VGFQRLVVKVPCADTTFYLVEKPRPGCNQHIPAFVQINFIHSSHLLRARYKVILLSALCLPGVFSSAHGEAGETRVAEDGGVGVCVVMDGRSTEYCFATASEPEPVFSWVGKVLLHDDVSRLEKQCHAA